jgi:hypothetical protein
MSILNNIQKGWSKYVLSLMTLENSEDEEEAKRKLDICAKCTHRKNMMCGLCMCYNKALVRSGKGCEIGKF